MGLNLLQTLGSLAEGWTKGQDIAAKRAKEAQDMALEDQQTQRLSNENAAAPTALEDAKQKLAASKQDMTNKGYEFHKKWYEDIPSLNSAVQDKAVPALSVATSLAGGMLPTGLTNNDPISPTSGTPLARSTSNAPVAPPASVGGDSPGQLDESGSLTFSSPGSTSETTESSPLQQALGSAIGSMVQKGTSDFNQPMSVERDEPLDAEAKTRAAQEKMNAVMRQKEIDSATKERLATNNQQAQLERDRQRSTERIAEIQTKGGIAQAIAGARAGAGIAAAQRKQELAQMKQDQQEANGAANIKNSALAGDDLYDAKNAGLNVKVAGPWQDTQDLGMNEPGKDSQSSKINTLVFNDTKKKANQMMSLKGTIAHNTAVKQEATRLSRDPAYIGIPYSQVLAQAEANVQEYNRTNAEPSLNQKTVKRVGGAINDFNDNL